jgi:hypothetical protein
VKTIRAGVIMNGTRTKMRGRSARARRRPVPPPVALGEIGGDHED